MPAFDMSEALKTIKKLTKQLERQKKKTLEWEMEYHEQEHLAESFEEDNKILKKEIEDLQDERYKMCGIANANGWDIYPTDDEETDEESEEEEDKPDRCVSCDKTFDLSYTMRHADKETKQKYDEYFGSEDDGGDLCTECLNK